MRLSQELNQIFSLRFPNLDSKLALPKLSAIYMQVPLFFVLETIHSLRYFSSFLPFPMRCQQHASPYLWQLRMSLDTAKWVVGSCLWDLNLLFEEHCCVLFIDEEYFPAFSFKYFIIFEEFWYNNCKNNMGTYCYFRSERTKSFLNVRI